MANPVHNLDEAFAEYFEFILKGKKYKFRYMTTEEVEHLQSFDKQEDKAQAYIYSFIEKVDADAPDFAEVAKKMPIPQYKKFLKMITAEYSA